MKEMDHVIICAVGFSGVGKDTFLSAYLEEYGGTKIGLTDCPRRQLIDLFGFSERQIFGPSSARNEGDMRYPKTNFHKYGLSHSPIQDGCFVVRAPEGLFRHDTSLYDIHYECGPMENTGLRTFFVPEKDPNFWLSPREALQVHCTTLQDLYEPIWIKNFLDVQLAWKREFDVIEDEHAVWAKSPVSYKPARGLHPIEQDPFATADRVQSVWVKNNFLICTDLRHKHEINYLRKEAKYHGYKLAVVRIKHPKIQSPPYQHRTETEQAIIPDKVFDFVIMNDGSVQDLRLKALDIHENVMSNSYKTKEELA